MSSKVRELQFATAGQQSIDGDGVKLTRLIGSASVEMLDPFLLLDSFESDQPQDYIGGFPNHPHRGFETVTYMFQGKMRHKDSIGNEGVIEPNGVQWMTAGRGIVHSEMPEQSNGMLHGLQLWVNLPKAQKMTTPSYQEFVAEQISTETSGDDKQVHVIAGETNAGTQGVINNSSVMPTYLDVKLSSNASFEQSLPSSHNAFVYVVNGELKVGTEGSVVKSRQLGVLTKGNAVVLTATANGTQFILGAGMPLKEPVERAGPFVMNTKQELMQAFDDFRNNRF